MSHEMGGFFSRDLDIRMINQVPPKEGLTQR